MMPDSGKLNYASRIGIFLIAAALIAGMAGCGPYPYSLTISSTEGGEVTSPGEGRFAYSEVTVVTIVADAYEGHRFIAWTGDADTVDDVNAPVTTITVNGDYSITANFCPEMSGNLEIRTWYDLAAVRCNLASNHTLMNDLDSTTAGYWELTSPTANGGKGWQPIGTDDDPFTGTLDGQGFEIRDLFVNRPADESFVGLFGYVGEGGVVGNIGMANTTVTGDVFVGGLVGVNLGTVSNSYSAGSVSGYDVVGGLVALNYGNMSYCHCTGSVTGTGSVSEVGGIGGLVGMNCGNISYCHSTGSVTGVSPAGGLVGVAYFGYVRDSYSTASVSGQDGVGGLAGVNGLGTVSNSYAMGSATGNLGVGGLMGANVWGTVIDSYSTGTVTGNEKVGGLAGFNANNGTVRNSYCTGSVTGNELVGGLLGDNTGNVTDSFWDTETSGQSTSAGGTGKNTTEMQDIITFSVVAWNIVEVTNSEERNPAYTWNIVDHETYPFLSWQL